MTGEGHQADLDLLNLCMEEDNRHCSFELIPQLTRFGGLLYGGTAIAASVAAMEIATERHALWVTTQYVSAARLGARIECTTEILALGRNIAQVHVAGRTAGQLVFVSVGSTASPREGELDGQFHTMPRTSSPEDSSPMISGRSAELLAFSALVEYRDASLAASDGPPPSMTLWARFPIRRPMTTAGIAFLSDMVPLAISRSAGKFGGGTSLDNSLRFGLVPKSLEWVLLELRGDLAVGGHGHGSVKVWTPDGVLLACGGQTSKCSSQVNRSHSVALPDRTGVG